MKSFSFLLLFTIFWTVKASDNDFGLDKGFFQKLLEEVKKSDGSKEDVFIDNIWPKIVEFLPESGIVPAVEVFDSAEDIEKAVNTKIKAGEEDILRNQFKDKPYECATETKIWPKYGDMFPTYAAIQENNRIFLETYSYLNLNEKPMVFELVKKKAGDLNSNPPITVNYKFPGKNAFKISFDSPNFYQEESTFTAECLVNITEVAVTKVSAPVIENHLDEKEKESVDHYWWQMATETQDISAIMSVAILRAINEKLKKETKYWICLSEDLQKKAHNNEDEYKYNDIYNVFCHGKKVQN